MQAGKIPSWIERFVWIDNSPFSGLASEKFLLPVLVKHLPGQHDQMSHGRRGTAGVESDVNVPAFHGTVSQFDEIKGSEDPDDLVDRLLGPHFAADPEVANRFAAGLYRDGKDSAEGGRVIPVRLKFDKVKEVLQPRYSNGNLMTDQYAIGAEVADVVFRERKDLFVAVVKRARNVDEETAGRIYDALKEGRDVTPEIAGGSHNSMLHREDRDLPFGFGAYMLNFGLTATPFGIDRKEYIDTYKAIMKREGIQGLKYQNTSPNETAGISDVTTYIVLDNSAVHPFWEKAWPVPFSKHLAGQHDQSSHGRRGTGGQTPRFTSYSTFAEYARGATEEELKKAREAYEGIPPEIRQWGSIEELGVAVFTEGGRSSFSVGNGLVLNERDFHGSLGILQHEMRHAAISRPVINENGGQNAMADVLDKADFRLPIHVNFMQKRNGNSRFAQVDEFLTVMGDSYSSGISSAEQVRRITEDSKYRIDVGREKFQASYSDGMTVWSREEAQAAVSLWRSWMKISGEKSYMPVLAKHLSGQHDQSTHGRRGAEQASDSDLGRRTPGEWADLGLFRRGEVLYKKMRALEDKGVSVKLYSSRIGRGFDSAPIEDTPGHAAMTLEHSKMLDDAMAYLLEQPKTVLARIREVKLYDEMSDLGSFEAANRKFQRGGYYEPSTYLIAARMMPGSPVMAHEVGHAAFYALRDAADNGIRESVAKRGTSVEVLFDENMYGILKEQDTVDKRIYNFFREKVRSSSMTGWASEYAESWKHEDIYDDGYEFVLSRTLAGKQGRVWLRLTRAHRAENENFAEIWSHPANENQRLLREKAMSLLKEKG